MKGEMSLIVSHPYEGRNEFDRFPPLWREKTILVLGFFLELQQLCVPVCF
jgi:hypothetical protein